MFSRVNGAGDNSTYRDPRRSAIMRQVVSISLAVMPFGIAFGVACSEAGLGVLDAAGFSALVFAGSAQFAAVSVLAGGGTVATAVVSGLLLNLRSVAFGVAMAPALRGPRWQRALASQLMIDESTAIGTAQTTVRLQRFGYLAGGLGIFVTWNAATVAGASLQAGTGDLVTTAGIDASIPAAFLALLWPRLVSGPQRVVAAGGAAIALATTPFLPAGVPVVAAGLAVLVVRPWRAPDAADGLNSDAASATSTSTGTSGITAS